MTEIWKTSEDQHVYDTSGLLARRVAIVYAPNKRERAHPIAAAPDLLEALEATLAAGGASNPMVAWTEAVAQARAAIAKAKGESQ